MNVRIDLFVKGKLTGSLLLEQGLVTATRGRSLPSYAEPAFHKAHALLWANYLDLAVAELDRVFDAVNVTYLA